MKESGKLREEVKQLENEKRYMIEILDNVRKEVEAIDFIKERAKTVEKIVKAS